MIVLLFGMIAERAGAELLELDAKNMRQLREYLTEKIKGSEDLSYSVAVDRVIVHGDMIFTGHEEIAVLPPFAGG